jgi:hypothetical protein
MTLQEGAGFFLRLLGLRGEIERNKRMVGEQTQEGGCLPGLPGSRKHEDGPRPGGAE